MPNGLDISKNSLLDLIRSYHEVSFRGVTVEMIEERLEADDDQREAAGSKNGQRSYYTFIPTLSGLYLMPKSGKTVSQLQQSNSTPGLASNERQSESA